MFTTMTVWATDPHVQYLAHHMLLLAIPAFLPAIVVVGVILYVALKDRANGDKSGAHQQSERPTKSVIDGPPIGAFRSCNLDNVSRGGSARFGSL